MKTKLNNIAAALVMALAVSGAHAANIVTNGAFDAGMTGWTCQGGDMCTLTNEGGTHGLAFIGYANYGYQSLFQDVTTVAGGTYQLKFDSRSYSSVNEIGYSFNGFSNVNWIAATTGFSQSVGSFTATGAKTKLEFFLATDPGTGTYVIDNVSLEQTGTANAVPEPGSLALMGLGVAGFIAARRKRKA